MHTIKLFIQHLFNCKDCQKQFLNDYSACKYDRCQMDSFDRLQVSTFVIYLCMCFVIFH